MKTLQELYTEVIASDALKAEFLALKTPEDIVAFAAKHGCEATLDDIKAFFQEKQNAEGELSEDDLEQVAGGKTAWKCAVDVVGMALGSPYICAGKLAVSLYQKIAKDIDFEGLLC